MAFRQYREFDMRPPGASMRLIGYLRWKVSKAGVGEVLSAPLPVNVMTFDLEAAADAPHGMVPVPAGMAGGYLAFLGALGPYRMPEFFADRLEVTNAEYQEFIDKRRLHEPPYWKEPFVDNGKTLSWEQAIERFRDSRGTTPIWAVCNERLITVRRDSEFASLRFTSPLVRWPRRVVVDCAAASDVSHAVAQRGGPGTVQCASL